MRTGEVGTSEHGSGPRAARTGVCPLRQGAAMNEFLHPLHARQVVDELERRIVTADTPGAENAQEDAQSELGAEATANGEPPD